MASITASNLQISRQGAVQNTRSLNSIRPGRVARLVPRTVVHEQKPGSTDKEPGVAFGANFWPPKPFTEHGAPPPEDDPANYEGDKRVGGPPESEVSAKKEEMKKASPFTEPNKPQGGTQAGGGGEGSAS